ncbi:MAG TPA: BadF/BadG/BcrA/BcrD ATPase family protein [Bryobacteraceae bacterium]|nr:BadF/BadG/BcrA/BcrD ATPase family protein [Bryobacteraceae bacterium]
MKLFLGVDGGQSSTTALIGDETGRILGSGVGGPCNHAETHEGRAKLEHAVASCLATACGQAGLDAATVQFEAACFGMSGGPEDKQSILEAMLRVGRLIVTTDAVVALAGATETGQGIIVIAGTGSMAFGRNARGRAARAGGWGYIYGDEGGAFDIVRQGLRAALRMEEGWGPATSLRERILQATGSADAGQALHRFYSSEWPRARQATLARLVDEAAGLGDAVASGILGQAAAQLAGFAASVRTQLWQPGEAVTVACIGGVFQSALVRERFRGLIEAEPATHCAAPLHGPDAGALLEAYRAAGLNPEIRW